MNKRRVDDLIPQVIDYINDNNNKIKNLENKVPREFNGYIANFGASIIQSGLLATVAFFERKESKSKEDREKLPQLIIDIINKNNGSNEKYLLDYIIKNKNKINLIKEEIIDIAVATKLAIRVFEFTEESSEEVNS